MAWLARSSFVVVAAALGACVSVEVEDHTGHGDVEAGLLVLEGDALAEELDASTIREADAAFLRLGLIWDADAPDGFEVSASPDLEQWTAWAAPVVHHTELEHTGSFVGQVELDGTPHRYYRLRRAGTSVPSFLRLELLATEQAASVEDSGGPEPVARTIGQADVHTRAEWSARPSTCTAGLGTAYRMAIHHTETPTNDSLSPAARLRQIQSYHMDVKGWCDVGYHYLMSRDGRLWEGRRDNLLGAHTGGANTGNLGIAVIGTHDSTPLTQAQVDALAALIRGLADQRGIAIERTRIKGHREYASSTCPGTALHGQIDAILARARGGSGGGGGDGGTTCSAASDGPWACNALTGATTNASGGYYTTSFGCWVDEDGVAHTDGGDNCLPACSLASIGCTGLSGPACERAINWYAADSDRFGCGTKIHVTNPDNGRSAVLMVIDRGPNCSIENIVDYWVLDMSYRASYHLFDGPTSAGERADVQVAVVSAANPLGPTGAAATCDGEPVPPPSDGTVTVIGVLYAGSDTANRIAGATVTFGDGRVTTTSPIGVWQFANVAAGAFTVTAAKPGYQTRTITGATYAAESWSSFGLSPAGSASGTAILQGVVYHGANSANRIPHAAIALSTGHVVTADDHGFYRLLALPAGDVTITASAPGYTTGSVSRTLVSGQTEWGSVNLAP